MKKIEKINLVSELTSKFKRAYAIILTEYKGLTHKQLEEIRRGLKPLGCEFIIAKNNLISIALKELNLNPKTILKDSTGIAIVYDSEESTIQSVLTVITRIATIKEGFVEGKENLDLLKELTPEVKEEEVVEEEKSTVNITLLTAGVNKIQIIKILREINPMLGLKEAKDIVDTSPQIVATDMSKDSAKEYKQKFEASGATVELS